MMSANDVGQSFSHGERLRARAFEIEKELGVGIAWLEQFDELERQHGFADAAHSLQTGDGNAADFDLGQQLFQLIFAAGKVIGWGWGLVAWCWSNRIERRGRIREYDVLIACNDDSV